MEQKEEFKSKLKIEERVLVLPNREINRTLVIGESITRGRVQVAFFDREDAIRYKDLRDKEDEKFFNNFNNIPE